MARRAAMQKAKELEEKKQKKYLKEKQTRVLQELSKHAKPPKNQQQPMRKKVKKKKKIVPKKSSAREYQAVEASDLLAEVSQNQLAAEQKECAVEGNGQNFQNKNDSKDSEDEGLVLIYSFLHLDVPDC